MRRLFTRDCEIILEQIRVNSLMLSKEHRKDYESLKEHLKFFRIPIIILSAFSSVWSLGGSMYLEQQYISLVSSFLGLLCATISSLEMYLAIQAQMEVHLSCSKDFYILAIDIYKILSLTVENRQCETRSFLDSAYSRYIRLIEISGVGKKMESKLLFKVPELCIQEEGTVTESVTVSQSTSVTSLPDSDIILV